MRTLKVTDFDSTSVDASRSSWGVELYASYVAVPNCIQVEEIKSVLMVCSKWEDDIIVIFYENGKEVRIKKVSEEDSPEGAIEHAQAEFKYFGLDPEDIKNWEAV
jgi:hypothetical protein